MTGGLSHADLDALLTSINPNAPAAASKAAEEEPETERYDFSHPELLSRDQIRTLRTLHEGFAQALAKKLSTELLANLTASVASVDHLTYAEFLMLLPSPTVLSVIEVKELDGNVAIEFNPTIAFSFVDRLLGGVGTALPKVRPLTAIEQGLMERVLTKCCQEIGNIWAPILPLTFELQSIEANPELARVVEPNEMVVLVTLEVKMNDVTGMMNLCLPYVVMEPALNRLSQGTAYPRAGARSPVAARQAIATSLGGSHVNVEVDLAEIDLDFGEILELERGDVLTFTPVPGGGARARLQGLTLLQGVPGSSRGQAAIQITSVVQDGGTAEGNSK